MTGTVMMMVLMLMTSTVSFEKETPTSKYANDNHSDSNDDNTDDDGDGSHLESHHAWLKISTFLMRAFPVNCLSCIFRNIWMIIKMISNITLMIMIYNDH